MILQQGYFITTQKKEIAIFSDKVFMQITSCPASISFLFKVCLPAQAGPNKNLLKMGSVGVSCTVDKKVEVEVKTSEKIEIIFNGEPIKFPTVSYVVEQLTKKPVRVLITSPLPLGCGFGISGASALATASALNKLFNLKKTKFELAEIAHVAEIVNHTGLGSVVTQITGGFLLKTKPGLPVSAIRFPFIGQKIYAVIIDRLLTPTILKDERIIQKVNSTADFYIQQIKNKKSLRLSDVLDASFDFVTRTGLLTDERLINLINRIKKSAGHAAMAILGQVVITDINPSLLTNYKIEELTIVD